MDPGLEFHWVTVVLCDHLFTQWTCIDYLAMGYAKCWTYKHILDSAALELSDQGEDKCWMSSLIIE